MSGPPPFPLTLEDITTEWLAWALAQDQPGVGVTGHRVIEVIRGTCTKVRIELDLDEAGQAAGISPRVILKGGFEPHSRAMHIMHSKEVIGYAEVFPQSPLRSPACWFARFDPERLQGIVIIDDLVARGVTFCDALVPQSADEVALRLTRLARHHAMTWNGAQMASGERFGWATSMFDNFTAMLLPMLGTQRWTDFCSAPRGMAVAARFRDADWFGDAFAKLCRLGARSPCALVHGDTHLGNLYVDIDGEPGFFDPSPQRAPAMHEIAYHVTGALDLGERAYHDRALVAHYREELVRCDVSPPPLEELMRQFAAFLAIGYCIFLVNDSYFQSEAINTAYTARFGEAMMDHRTQDVIAAIICPHPRPHSMVAQDYACSGRLRSGRCGTEAQEEKRAEGDERDQRPQHEVIRPQHVVDEIGQHRRDACSEEQ